VKLLDAQSCVEHLVSPIPLDERSSGRPLYFSDVIVRRESSIEQFEDLEGHSWSFNDLHSLSGHHIMMKRIIEVQQGRSTDQTLHPKTLSLLCASSAASSSSSASPHKHPLYSFFSNVLNAGSHLNSIEKVLNGEVESATVDSQVLEAQYRRNPSLREHLKSVATLGPSSIQPVIIASTLPSSLKRQLRHIFTELLSKDTDSRRHLEAACVSGFTTLDDSSFDNVRDTLKLMKEYGLEIHEEP